MRCPDENQLVALFEQDLAGDQREEIERHVDGCARCRELVAAVARSGAGDRASLDDREAERAPVPEVASGRYEILSLIGSGGMGNVYAAFDPHLGRKIAIKFVRRVNPTRLGRAERRAVREARALARVTHPNVLAIYDVGVMQGQVFLVMELVHGVTLREWVKSERPTWRATLEALVKAGRGLAAAHDARLIHRDFKPDNVLVGKDGRVLVSDFGLTRVEADPASTPAVADSASANDDERLTRDGVLLGTRGYIAPEVLDGAVADARSDIYSYAVAARELLLGVRPDAVAARELLLGVRPDSVAARAPSGSDVPRALRRVIERGLSHEPGARHASMHALLADLESAVRPKKRRAKLAVGAIAGALAVAASASAVVFHGHGAPHLAGHATMADRAGESRGGPAAVSAYRMGMQSLRGASNLLGIKEIQRAVSLDPSLAAAHVRLIYFASEDPEIEEGRVHYKTAFDLRAELSPHDQALLDALEPLTRDPPDTDERAKRLRLAAARFPEDAELAWYLGEVYVDLGDRARAVAALDRALALDPGYALAYWMKGLADLYAADDAAAFAEFGRCVDVSPGAASCLRIRGSMFAQLGKCASHLADARRVVEVEPEGYAAYAMLARALAGEPDTYAAVEQALQQKWALAPERERTAIEGRDKIDLAILRGDFTDAQRLIDALDRASAPAERPHAELLSRLFDVTAETGDDGRAVAAAKEFLARRKAWSGGLGDRPEDLAKNPVPRALALLVSHGEMDPARGHAATDAWVQDWRARLSPQKQGYIWFAAHAVPAGTAAEADTALRARATFGLPGALVSSAVLDLEEGIVLSLATDAHDRDDAIPLLERGTRACVGLEEPALQMRARLALARTYEARADTHAACEAYGAVLLRWGDARPRSATADTARARALALGCAR